MSEVKFEREDRYAVIKYKKLSNSQRAKIPSMMDDFASACVDCIVVEKDWPEYNFVWLMLEHRMAGFPVPDFNAVKCAADVGVALSKLAAETLRADTAEAERDTERKFRESAEGGWHEANRVIAMQRERLDADEQRIAKLRELLHLMTVEYACCLEAGYDRITSLGGDCDSFSKMLDDNVNYAKACAALNPKPDPAKELWLDIGELPDHKVGAKYRMILDDTPQVCVELEMEGRKRWFYGEENGPFPEDEIQAWLPINPKPEAGSHE